MFENKLSGLIKKDINISKTNFSKFYLRSLIFKVKKLRTDLTIKMPFFLKPSSKKLRIKTVINYVRFSIHSDIGFSKMLLSWKVLKRNPLYFLVFPAGYLLAIRDNYKNKVEKTYIEFEKNINQHNLQISRHKIIR